MNRDNLKKWVDEKLFYNLNEVTDNAKSRRTDKYLINLCKYGNYIYYI